MTVHRVFPICGKPSAGNDFAAIGIRTNNPRNSPRVSDNLSVKVSRPPCELERPKQPKRRTIVNYGLSQNDNAFDRYRLKLDRV